MLFGFPLALVTPTIGVVLMRLATGVISMVTGGRDTIFDYLPVTIYQRTVTAIRKFNTLLICALDQTCVETYITT